MAITPVHLFWFCCASVSSTTNCCYQPFSACILCVGGHTQRVSKSAESSCRVLAEDSSLLEPAPPPCPEPQALSLPPLAYWLMLVGVLVLLLGRAAGGFGLFGQNRIQIIGLKTSCGSRSSCDVPAHRSPGVLLQRHCWLAAEVG